MVKSSAAPGQDNPRWVKLGVTCMLAVTGPVPALMAEKEDMLPVPVAASPMVVLELLQEYAVVPPVNGEVKAGMLTGWPWQRLMSEVGVTAPAGLTVMVNDWAVPGQLTRFWMKVGVTAMVAANGLVVVFCPLKPGRLPEPEAAKPMAGMLLAQVKEVVPPVLGDKKATGADGPL